MRSVLLITGTVLLALAVLAENKEPIRLTEGWGVTRLYGNLAPREVYDEKADDAFEFLVEEVPFEEVAADRSSVKSWWGADGQRPPLVVKRVTFRIGGRDVIFPREAYADLGDMAYPPRLRVEQHGRDFHLLLSASDAHAGYTATFVVRGLKLRQRIVEFGEFPEQRSVTKFN